MSKVNPTVTFPSGRTIAEVKKDAKRFARTTGIQHSNALNTLARVNGMDMNWNRAMAALSRNGVADEVYRANDDGPPRIHYVGAIHEQIEHRPLPTGSERLRNSCHPNTDLHIRLVRALALYRKGDVPLNEIADRFSIPRDVLRRRVRGLPLVSVLSQWDSYRVAETKDERTLSRKRRKDAE